MVSISKLTLLASLFFASSTLVSFSPALAVGYETDFGARPGYLPNNAISLTFDDAPDWNNTGRVLDTLRDKGVKATFFINAANFSNINTDEPMRELVRRMVREGHTLANHTAHHGHLPWMSDAEIEAEISVVENAVSSVFGGTAPRLTLLRAPFGEPYQFPDGNYERVSSIVARHAVHIGWNVDSFDYLCPGDSGCVYNNIMNKVNWPGSGDYGIVLMHSVHAQTADALPALIDNLRARGFAFWSVEDVVRAKHGRSSAELVGGGGGGGNPPPSGALVDGRTYMLSARHSGKCLDVPEWSQAPGMQLSQWACHGGGNQQFIARHAGDGSYSLQNVHSGLCLDIDAWGTGNGSRIIQWTCHAGENQRVRVRGSVDGSLKAAFVYSGKCLDVAQASPNDGARVHQWDCLDNQANQDWYFRPL